MTIIIILIIITVFYVDFVVILKMLFIIRPSCDANCGIIMRRLIAVMTSGILVLGSRSMMRGHAICL